MLVRERVGDPRWQTDSYLGHRAHLSPTSPDGVNEVSRTGAEDGALRTMPRVAPMLLTAKQVETALQLGRTTTYQLLRSGEIPVVRVGRALRVSRQALEHWIGEHSGIRTA